MLTPLHFKTTSVILQRTDYIFLLVMFKLLSFIFYLLERRDHAQISFEVSPNLIRALITG